MKKEHIALIVRMISTLLIVFLILSLIYDDVKINLLMGVSLLTFLVLELPKKFRKIAFFLLLIGVTLPFLQEFLLSYETQTIAISPLCFYLVGVIVLSSLLHYASQSASFLALIGSLVIAFLLVVGRIQLTLFVVLFVCLIYFTLVDNAEVHKYSFNGKSLLTTVVLVGLSLFLTFSSISFVKRPLDLFGLVDWGLLATDSKGNGAPLNQDYNLNGIANYNINLFVGSSSDLGREINEKKEKEEEKLLSNTTTQSIKINFGLMEFLFIIACGCGLFGYFYYKKLRHKEIELTIEEQIYENYLLLKKYDYLTEEILQLVYRVRYSNHPITQEDLDVLLKRKHELEQEIIQTKKKFERYRIEKRDKLLVYSYEKKNNH